MPLFATRIAEEVIISCRKSASHKSKRHGPVIMPWGSQPERPRIDACQPTHGADVVGSSRHSVRVRGMFTWHSSRVESSLTVSAATIHAYVALHGWGSSARLGFYCVTLKA